MPKTLIVPSALVALVAAAFVAANSLVVRGATVAPGALPATAFELLGNPSTQRYDDSRLFARNVWDMQVYDGRLFIGSGNSDNEGPAQNAGPVDVWCYERQAGRFVSAFVLDDEQLAVFRLAGSDLLIPGHDPRESWKLGNFYRCRDRRWEKMRTIPEGVHTYDIIQFQDLLYVAVSTNSMGGVVDCSADDGKTWRVYPIGRMIPYQIPGTVQVVDIPTVGRTISLFTIRNQLFVSSIFKHPNDRGSGPRVDRWLGDRFERVREELFPQTEHSDDAMVVRPVNFHDRLLYIGADRMGDHHWTPRGLFTAASIDTARAVPLLPGEVPYDIVVNDDHCYVLTDLPPRAASSGGQHVIRVLRTQDLNEWTEVARLVQPTFARSLELLDGDLYLGLGCDATDLRPETGNILRVRKNWLENTKR